MLLAQMTIQHFMTNLALPTCRVHDVCHVYQCLKLMVAQSLVATKNWAGPVKFHPGQVKIIID